MSHRASQPSSNSGGGGTNPFDTGGGGSGTNPFADASKPASGGGTNPFATSSSINPFSDSWDKDDEPIPSKAPNTSTKIPTSSAEMPSRSSSTTTKAPSDSAIAIPTALLSGPSAQTGAAATASTGNAVDASNNPFDFDVDFSVVQKRRERARAAKESAKEDAAQPILPGMDASDPDKPPTLLSTPQPSSSAEASSRRPNIVNRSKTTGTDLATSGRKSRGFFGFGGGGGKDMPGGGGHHYSHSTGIDPLYEDGGTDQALMIGNRRLAVWPFDDYHLVQKLYYQKFTEAQRRHEDDEDDDDNGRGDVGETKRDKGSAASKGTPARLYGTNMSQLMMTSPDQQSSIPIFSRPADPPDIPTAVQGLSLTDFQQKAEERAIAIVSTWLFDVGLIDELLVHGGIVGGSAPPDDKSVHSTPSAEGIEIGSHGYPIEGASKMDKEIAKLRNSTKRQLALINARLNDGVAATGSEVQELVHAVIATKDDIGRLRELSSYVSNTGDVDQTNQFMLTKYPKLKQAINARRNLARCFRELDFFSQIPSTCDRLREELHAGEWTAHEWSTLRQVCREHVELEMFLVEAEAGMKKRAAEEEEEEEEDRRVDRRSSRAVSYNKFGRKAFRQSGLPSNKNNDLIDGFLQEHVENVWELGDEIRLRIMSGISNAFDLAVNNPAGMVALVEAVEAYEAANEEYKSVHGEELGTSQTSLRFTDMRAAALGELFKDFETRGLDLFRDLTMQAADVAEEGNEAANRQFSAVLRAANELTSEIGIVKEQMGPCFPPNWSIETLWTTCVAHLCSTNILQQIGGPDGQKLPDLTVTQLLDLVAWVETFREIIEETFPNIGSITSKRTYFDQPPKLLVDNNKTVDIEVAKDSLAWVNNTLWDVHDLAKDEFLFRTKEQTEEWLNNVYEAEHTKTQTSEGRLTTSLCEDVWALAGVQLRTIRERLTRKSEALVQAVGVILKNLYEKQIMSREVFCADFETCCAAANDFIRMSDKCEEIVQEIQEECSLSAEATETLEEQAAAILGLYSSDAVYAAQKTHVYCFEPIEEAVAGELFGKEWENHLTHNELALTLVRTLDDFMEDLETFLDEVMVQKAVEAQVTSAVNFYIKILLSKSDKHKSSRDSWFENTEKAIARMRSDVVVMREYFDGLAESMPTLTRVIEKEFSLLEAVFELLAIAAGLSKSDAHDFILVLQKRVRNVPITRYVVGDLYHLVNPAEERNIYEVIDAMEAEMMAVAPTDDNAVSKAQDRNTVPGLRIDQILAKHCGESTRKRPLKASAMERAEAALLNWRVTWSQGAAKE